MGTEEYLCRMKYITFTVCQRHAESVSYQVQIYISVFIYFPNNFNKEECVVFENIVTCQNLWEDL
jgi:hypothetical protein